MILYRGKNVQDTDIISGEFTPEEGWQDSILTIVPTNRRVRSRIRELLLHDKRGVVAAPRIETLTTLTRKLLGGMQNAPQFITMLQSLYILKQLLANDDYYYLNTGQKNISALTLESLRYAISEYKRYNVLSSDMEEDIAANELPHAMVKKAEDFWLAYISYYEVLERRNLCDDSSALVKLISLPAEQLQVLFKDRFSGVTSVLLEGFTEFSSAEIELLTNMAEENSCTIYIRLDYRDDNPGLFGSISSTIEQLTSYGFLRLQEKTAAIKDSLSGFAAKNFMNDYFSNKKLNVNNTVRLYEAENRQDELSYICTKMAEMLHSGEFKPGEIALVVNDISMYAQDIRGKFKEYGLPLNLTDRIRINTIPEINYFIALFSVSHSGYYFRDIARIISSGFIATPLTIVDFYEIASEAKVTRGYKAWMKALGWRIEKIQKDKERFSAEQYSKKLEKAEALKTLLEKLHQLSRPFSTELTAKEFETAFKKFCYQIELVKKLLSHSYKREKVYTAFSYFLKELSATLKLYKDEDSGQKYSFEFYVDMIRTIVRSTRFNMREEPNAEIIVSTPEELRGLRFKVLFIAGLTDGNFPFSYRKKLFFGNKIPGDEKKHVEAQAYLFYQMLLAFKEKLILSYPKFNGRGEDSPSILLNEFLRRFDVTLVSKEETAGRYRFSELELKKLRASVIGHASEAEYADIYTAESVRLSKIQAERTFSNFEAVDYNGILAPGVILNGKLKPRISVSSLERFNKCHQQYLYASVFGLKQLEEPEEGLKAHELGNLIHLIFFRFYTERKPGKVEAEKEFPFLRNIAMEEGEKFNKDSPLTFFDFEKLLGAEDKPKTSLLWHFLQREESEEIFTPVAFELPFKEQLSVPLEKGEVSVEFRGVIDRIEVNNEMKIYAVTDYKTGTPPKGADMKKGKSLQLPFYSSVAGKLLKEKSAEFAEYIPGEMFFYRVSKTSAEIEKNPVRARPLNKNHSIAKPKDFDKITGFQRDMIAENREFILQYIKEIYSGSFPLLEKFDPEFGVCKYCNFIEICRVKERKESAVATDSEESDSD